MGSGEKLYMVNVAAATIESKGNVIMKFTSRKEMTLLDVLHVPKIHKNLVPIPMLSKKDSNLFMNLISLC